MEQRESIGRLLRLVKGGAPELPEAATTTPSGAPSGAPIAIGAS